MGFCFRIFETRQRKRTHRFQISKTKLKPSQRKSVSCENSLAEEQRVKGRRAKQTALLLVVLSLSGRELENIGKLVVYINEWRKMSGRVKSIAVVGRRVCVCDDNKEKLP